MLIKAVKEGEGCVWEREREREIKKEKSKHVDFLTVQFLAKQGPFSHWVVQQNLHFI